MTARIIPFPKREEPTRSTDWLMALVWACLAGICLGFMAGVAFAIVELVN